MDSSNEGHPKHSGDESTSPRTGSKVVSFPDESISPLMIAKSKELDQKDYLDLDKSSRQYTASLSRKRLSGRSSIERLGSFNERIKPQNSDANPSLSSLISDSSADGQSHHHTHDGLMKQVTAWIKHEKTRRAARRARRKGNKKVAVVDQEQSTGTRSRSNSDSSQGSVALDQLADILEKTLSIKPADTKRRYAHVRRLSSGLKRHSVISVDSDYFDSVDQLVPNCEAVLDNSKTLAYPTESPSIEDVNATSEQKVRKEKVECKEAWDTFKFEILRIVHTLRLKGWRKVPMDLSEHLEIERMCGALTNAVYVVSPPKDLPKQEESADGGPPKPRNPPPKLLLRIYGPQVDHLIDRESELKILQRLARKRIGPCLLGTFLNGRFEEYLHAKALSAQELRQAETSKQIAKRMRELHEGIDLLKEERQAGPFVWQNWDKWVDRCEQIVTWLDEQVRANKQDSQLPGDKWKKRGYVCGVEWSVFRQTVEKYRKWLEEQYGGIDKINERLVFAHNDTQYGNILRMVPEGESPLLLPANKHKQLVVIDFEYSNANLPGLEFANHFTEWAYNYHDPDYSWRCNTKYYPTLEEQHRFICTYLMHTPSYRAPGGSASNPSTPHLGPLPTSGSTTALAATAAPNTISEFMLDSRAPPGEKYSYNEQEAQREQQTELEARRLMAETKLWRLANSAQWVAWGIVQAHVPGLPDFDGSKKDKASPAQEAAELSSATLEMKAAAEAPTPAQSEHSNTAGKEAETGNTNENGLNGDDAESQDEEEFDYLAYAQDRAMFMWGDAVRMGMIKAEDLPESLRERLKVVEY